MLVFNNFYSLNFHIVIITNNFLEIILYSKICRVRAVTEVYDINLKLNWIYEFIFLRTSVEWKTEAYLYLYIMHIIAIYSAQESN